MPIEFIHPTGEEPMYTATRRLYVNRDYTRVVEEHSPEAAFLLATEGTEIEEALARRLGLLEKPAPKPKPAPDPEPEITVVESPSAARAMRGRPPKAREEPTESGPLDRHPFPGKDG